MTSIDDDHRAWGGVIKHMSTSNAVNSTLIAALAGMFFGTLGLRFAPPETAIVFSIVMLAPLAVLLLQVLYFSIFDRDRLQNDRHVEKKMMRTAKIGYFDGSSASEITLPPSDRLIENPVTEREVR